MSVASYFMKAKTTAQKSKTEAEMSVQIWTGRTEKMRSHVGVSLSICVQMEKA